MKKSNIALIALAAIAAAFLLWFWYYLEFNKIDNPLDLIVAICWWVICGVAVGLIRKVEKAREEKVRTCYVGPNFVFNAETGIVGAGEGALETIEGILANLEYGFDRQELADGDKLGVRAIVRTAEYDRKDNDTVEWTGEVAFVDRKDEDPVKFTNKEELAAILEFGRA